MGKHLLHAKRRTEKRYNKEGNGEDSSQEKVRLSNKTHGGPKADVRASMRGYVGSDPGYWKCFF